MRGQRLFALPQIGQLDRCRAERRVVLTREGVPLGGRLVVGLSQLRCERGNLLLQRRTLLRGRGSLRLLVLQGLAQRYRVPTSNRRQFSS